MISTSGGVSRRSEKVKCVDLDWLGILSHCWILFKLAYRFLEADRGSTVDARTAVSLASVATVTSLVASL